MSRLYKTLFENAGWWDWPAGETKQKTRRKKGKAVRPSVTNGNGLSCGGMLVLVSSCLRYINVFETCLGQTREKGLRRFGARQTARFSVRLIATPALRREEVSDEGRRKVR